MKTKYYDNDHEKGKIIDYNAAVKRCIKKGIFPKELLHDKEGDFTVYVPKYDMNKAKWQAIVSERSIGKTTTFLCIGLDLYHNYGTITHYVREVRAQITQAKVETLFTTIIKFDYISKITEGRWNYIIYKPLQKKWFLSNRDKEGKITEVDSKYFMYDMSLDDNYNYKSSYVCHDADFIIFDEFCSPYYKRNDFVVLCDLISTLKRKRLSSIIVMLSNTIDRNSEYFDELEIRDFIDVACLGESEYHSTSKGTMVYCEIAKSKMTESKRINNELFFGFMNKNLGAITGEDWATENYPHIEFNKDDYTTIARNIYILVNQTYLQFEIINHIEIGLCALVHKSNIPYKNDAIIYTTADISKYNQIYGQGYGSELDRLVWDILVEGNRVFYSNNTIGAKLKHYIDICKYL